MKTLKSICVYCSASNKINPIFEEDARAVGKLLAQRNIKLVYGGNTSGLMGTVAGATLKNGGYVIGYTTKQLSIVDGAHEDIQELHIVADMSSRKNLMYTQSDAFLVLPGGLGTLEEIAEIISWKQLRLHDKPIVILNTRKYWDKLQSLLQHMVDEKFAPKSLWDMVTFVDHVDKVPTALMNQLEKNLPKYKWD